MWSTLIGWSPAYLEDDWEKPYWPVKDCNYAAPAWYGKKQRPRVRNFWNSKFDPWWLYPVEHGRGKSLTDSLYAGAGYNAYSARKKFMERFLFGYGTIGSTQVSEPDRTKEIYSRWLAEDHSGE
jgi:hypothetical protein